VFCQVCRSTLKAGDLYCSSCGAVVPGRLSEASKPPSGERKYLTVLCVDLQRSTDLISELDPEEAISRLEPALIAMRTAVRRNRGIVSKEGGDGLIALFGAPHADDNHAVMACHAAVELVRRIKLLEDPGLHVRVGIHSGYVVRTSSKRTFPRSMRRAGRRSIWSNGSRAQPRPGKSWSRNPAKAWRPGWSPSTACRQDEWRDSRAGSLLRTGRNQRLDALASPLDQGAFVLCRTLRRNRSS
jgi:hypothetical protein